jgi:hypothetical protein
MFTISRITARCGAAMLLALAGGITACSGGDSPARSSDGHKATGTIVAALSAVGPDLATYSFTPGTVFELSSTGSPTTLFIPLDGASPTQSFSVPAGQYTGTIQAPGSSLSLNRSAAGTVSTVPAVVIDPQPYAVTVNTGATTNLVFNISVPTLGQVQFSTGTLSTSLSVDASVVQPTRGRLTLPSFTLSNYASSGDLTVVDPFLSSVTFSPPTVAIEVDFSITSPFQPQVDAICAAILVPPVTNGLTIFGGTPSPGSTASNVATVLLEASTGSAPGILCISDQSTSPAGPFGGIAANSVAIRFDRTGSPQTGLFQSVLNSVPGSKDFSFTFQGAAAQGTTVYDGSSADLTLLKNGLPVSGSVFVGVQDGAGSALVSGVGGASVQFLP